MQKICKNRWEFLVLHFFPISRFFPTGKLVKFPVSRREIEIPGNVHLYPWESYPKTPINYEIIRWFYCDVEKKSKSWFSLDNNIISDIINSSKNCKYQYLMLWVYLHTLYSNWYHIRYIVCVLQKGYALQREAVYQFPCESQHSQKSGTTR